MRSARRRSLDLRPDGLRAENQCKLESARKSRDDSERGWRLWAGRMKFAISGNRFSEAHEF